MATVLKSGMSTIPKNKKTKTTYASGTVSVANPQSYSTYDGKTYTVPNTYGQFTKTTPAATTTKVSTNVSTPSLQGYDFSNNSMYGGSSGSYSGSHTYDVAKQDISELLAAYENMAKSNNQIAQTLYDTTVRNANDTYNQTVNNAQTNYNNTRNDLLTSLKRFQEQNAKDVAEQRRSYQTEQASLESAREAADRNTRISNAARGLAGSGLQQLAQLQNLLSQGEEISGLATENQNARERLATALAQQMEDNATQQKRNEETYNTTLNNALTAKTNTLSDASRNLANSLSSIASELASNKANAASAAESNYVNALNNMRAQAAAYSSSGSSSGGAANSIASLIANNLTGMQDDLNRNLSNIASMPDKEAKATAKSLGLSTSNPKASLANYYADVARSTLASNNENYGLSTANYNTANNNINNILRKYGYISGSGTSASGGVSGGAR